MNTIDLSLDDIEQLAHDCLVTAGANEDNAQAVASIIRLAERDGSTSHGLFRLPGYLAALNSGKVNGQAEPQLDQVTPVLLRCHGQNGYAPLAHQHTRNALAEAANKFGVAILALHHSHHFAALWPEVEALAEQGLFAMTCVSYMPAVAPAGGASALFGTNPMAWAWPRAGQNPLVLDMATAAMARGEVAVAARDGHRVPPGTGLDASGQPSTDPNEILKGVLLPFGGAKGSGLAMMVELLAGPMVGETLSFETAQRDNKDGGPPQGGQLIIAMNPKLVGGVEVTDQTEAFVQRLQAIEGTRLPGARRHKNRKNIGTRSIDKDLVAKLW